MNNLPSNILKLFCLLIFLLVLFDILFIRILKFDKIAWKRTDYVWLSIAALSLVSLSFQVRSWLAEQQAELAKIQAKTHFSLLLNYIGPQEPPRYICRIFMKDWYSTANFEEVQKEYDQICEWNRQLLKNLHKLSDDCLPKIEYNNIKPPITPIDPILREYLDTIKTYLNDYNKLRREYFNLKKKSLKNNFEEILFYIWPVLICVALALRITKVRGEIKLEKT